MTRASKIEHDSWASLTNSSSVWGWDVMGELRQPEGSRPIADFGLYRGLLPAVRDLYPTYIRERSTGRCHQ